MPRRDAAMRESRCNGTSQRLVRIRFTIENGNGDEIEQGPPASPRRQLRQIVRPDQPYEIDFIMTFQSLDRIHGITRTNLLFQIRDKNPGMTGGDRLGRRHAIGQIGHVVPGFQGVLRRDQPPDPIQTETADRFEADRPMTGMGGIERPPQQPHPGAPGSADFGFRRWVERLWQVSVVSPAIELYHRPPAPNSPRGGAISHDGRICPSPRT